MQPPAACPPVRDSLQGQLRPIPVPITPKASAFRPPCSPSQTSHSYKTNNYTLCVTYGLTKPSFLLLPENKCEQPDHLSCFDVVNSFNFTVFCPGRSKVCVSEGLKSMQTVFSFHQSFSGAYRIDLRWRWIIFSSLFFLAIPHLDPRNASLDFTPICFLIWRAAIRRELLIHTLNGLNVWSHMWRRHQSGFFWVVLAPFRVICLSWVHFVSGILLYVILSILYALFIFFKLIF